MAARKAHGQDGLGWVDGLGEQVRGQREGAEVLEHDAYIVASRSIELSRHDPSPGASSTSHAARWRWSLDWAAPKVDQAESRN